MQVLKTIGLAVIVVLALVNMVLGLATKGLLVPVLAFGATIAAGVLLVDSACRVDVKGKGR